MPQARMLAYASRQHELFLKHTQPDVARKAGVMHILGREMLGHLNLPPIIGQTRLVFQAVDFFFRQFPVNHDNNFSVFSD